MTTNNDRFIMIVIYFLTNSLNTFISIQGTILPSLFRILREQQEMANSTTAETIAVKKITSDKT